MGNTGQRDSPPCVQPVGNNVSRARVERAEGGSGQGRPLCGEVERASRGAPVELGLGSPVGPALEMVCGPPAREALQRFRGGAPRSSWIPRVSRARRECCKLLHRTPHDQARKPLTLVASHDTVRLLDPARTGAGREDEVARHRRCYDRGQTIEDPSSPVELNSIAHELSPA